MVDGHHVVLRGIRLQPFGQTEAELHYEFVPGLVESERDAKGGFFWFWTLRSHDDLDTEYNENNSGVFDPNGGNLASHGSRDLGGLIPIRGLSPHHRVRTGQRMDPARSLVQTGRDRPQGAATPLGTPRDPVPLPSLSLFSVPRGFFEQVVAVGPADLRAIPSPTDHRGTAESD